MKDISTIRKTISKLERANRAAEKLSEGDLRAHIRYCEELLARLEAERERALVASGLDEAQQDAIRRGKGVRQERYIKCGKPDCHCARGKGHGPYLYLLVCLGPYEEGHALAVYRESVSALRMMRVTC